MPPTSRRLKSHTQQAVPHTRSPSTWQGPITLRLPRYLSYCASCSSKHPQHTRQHTSVVQPHISLQCSPQIHSHAPHGNATTQHIHGPQGLFHQKVTPASRCAVLAVNWPALHCKKIAEAEAVVSVNEKNWLVMHVHV